MTDTDNGGIAAVADPPTLEDIQAHAERLEAEMADHCGDLRRMLEDEQRLRNDLDRILDASSVRMKKMQRALAALEGTTAATPKRQAEEKDKNHGWQVSEERIAFVLELYKKQLEPITSTQLGETTVGISTETVAKATAVLRERELVRKVKKVRGGGWTYALMPGVIETPELEAVSDAA